MLSAKYHAHHWLMSVGAINAYDMFVPKSEDFNGRLFLYPLLAYAAYTVLAGPRPPLRRSLASYISVAYNVVATGWLMVWLGIVADDYALRRTYLGRFTRTMVHAILAFNVMCAFDSIGQNVSHYFSVQFTCCEVSGLLADHDGLVRDAISTRPI